MRKAFKISEPFLHFHYVIRAFLATFLLAILSACSTLSSAAKPQLAALGAVTGAVSAKQAWSARIGLVNFPLDVSVVGATAFVAGGDGSVVALDTESVRD